ncbi:hypothetical protein LCGC14_0579880 [marine sediment metagenome]|uniref:Uncharacterized protein n=1 Tax=marine sediment metagenome TaxID=412755 RepID=A0A0F9U2Y1_9ZZZZ
MNNDENTKKRIAEKHDWWEKSQKAKEDLKKHNAVLGKGLVVGKIFQIGVGDGYAFYEVIRINKTTVSVKWVENEFLNPDEYMDFMIGGESTINKDKIQCIIECEEIRNNVLSKTSNFTQT